MMLGRLCIIGVSAGAVACGAARPAERRAAPVVLVAEPPAFAKLDGALPPSAERLPPPEPDPFLYYVGSWDGVVSHGMSASANTLRTMLHVSRDGQFEVQYLPRPGEQACRLAGRFRAAPELIELDVDYNTCPQDHGPVLERPIVSRTDDEFMLRSPDSVYMYRYTRRPKPSR